MRSPEVSLTIREDYLLRLQLTLRLCFLMVIVLATCNSFFVTNDITSSNSPQELQAQQAQNPRMYVLPAGNQVTGVVTAQDLVNKLRIPNLDVIGGK